MERSDDSNKLKIVDSVFLPVLEKTQFLCSFPQAQVYVFHVCACFSGCCTNISKLPFHSATDSIFAVMYINIWGVVYFY